MIIYKAKPTPNYSKSTVIITKDKAIRSQVIAVRGWHVNWMLPPGHNEWADGPCFACFKIFCVCFQLLWGFWGVNWWVLLCSARFCCFFRLSQHKHNSDASCQVRRRGGDEARLSPLIESNSVLEGSLGMARATCWPYSQYPFHAYLSEYRSMTNKH